MNIAKNMEAIFLSIAVLAGATAYATAAQPEIAVPYSAPVAAATMAAAIQPDAAMPVVVVAAKRLSAAEKAALAE